MGGDFNLPKATFILLAAIIGTMLLLVLMVTGGCMFGALGEGKPGLCAGNTQEAVREIINQLLTIALGMLGGSGAALYQQRRDKIEPPKE